MASELAKAIKCQATVAGAVERSLVAVSDAHQTLSDTQPIGGDDDDDDDDEGGKPNVSQWIVDAGPQVCAMVGYQAGSEPGSFVTTTTLASASSALTAQPKGKLTLTHATLCKGAAHATALEGTRLSRVRG